MNTTSYIIYGVMIGWGSFSAYYIFNLWRQKNTDKYNPYLYNSIPSIFTTLGVLGTFIGIFIGLQGFDVANIDKSIPILLDGMKTAFSTSITGIILSIIFRIIGQNVLRYVELKEPIKQTSELSALSEIVAILKDTNTETRVNSNQLAKLINQSSKNHSEVATILKEVNKEAKNNSSQIINLINLSSENHISLENKFDEFGEILKKNNTEALVEVMKSATETFNAQMSELIQRLVQENFQELNNSVQSLNTWQHENKEMIKSLTNQFKDVSENLTISSSSIKEIAQNTNKLTNDNSHLVKLIQELQKVMIDDRKFQEVAEKLVRTVTILEKNTVAFDNTTNKLNQWILKEQGFKQSVDMLVHSLKEIEKIKDINAAYWNNTKTQLEGGVSLIANASTELRDSLDNISGQFTEQLGQTLVGLDELIQRLIIKAKTTK